MLHRGNIFVTCAILTGVLVGCGDSEGDGGSGGNTATSTTGNGPGSSSANGSTNATTASSSASAQASSSTGFTGDPIMAPEEEWTWVDFPDSKCMNDTPTGIGVNFTSASENLVIFLMGGNACFNTLSCAITANKDGYGASKFANDAAGLDGFALLDRNGSSPIADYNFVYVPYCTGDVFAGDKANASVGGGNWQFNGYKNIGAFLNRLVPTFPNAQKVILTGVSAGGFGAAYNYNQVASAFPNAKVTLLDDSGPPMGSEFIPACLQQHFIDTWGIDATLPADCPTCLGADGIFIEPYVDHIKSKFPNGRFGIISTENDSTIRNFWGFGENDCASINGAPPPYSGDKYKAGLEDIRDRMFMGNDNFALFMVPGTEHVLLDNDPSTVTVNGTTLQTWLTQGIGDDPAWTSVSEP